MEQRHAIEVMQRRLDRSVDADELRRTHRQSEALAAQLRALHEERIEVATAQLTSGGQHLSDREKKKLFEEIAALKDRVRDGEEREKRLQVCSTRFDVIRGFLYIFLFVACHTTYDDDDKDFDALLFVHVVCSDFVQGKCIALEISSHLRLKRGEMLPLFYERGLRARVKPLNRSSHLLW